MRLIRRADKGFESTVSADLAALLVESALMRGHSIDGLDQFGLRWSINRDSDIVEAVRNGDLLLVRTAIISSGGGSMPRPRPEPEPVRRPPEQWPLPKPREDLVFAKSKMADGTLYTDDQLRRLSHATTRVRFQFRRDAEGVLQVYGIHSGPSGDDAVRTVQVTWNADRTAMEAKLNDLTLIWTPKQTPHGTLPPLTYPEDIGKQLDTIFVHPIAEDADSQIEGLPGEDITAEDWILVFPADTGLKSLYVVFARPFGGDHDYHPPPLSLPAFPDAIRVRRKGKRQRWESKRRIYEWDYQHGAVEVYDKQRNHLGEFDAYTGEQTGEARPERKITTK